jgi:chitin disaccharide deacetylase
VKNLIVNADDLGWTDGVNRGIAESHRQGLVTSASLLANGRAFAGAIAIARDNPALGVGVHLNLSDGVPIAPVDTVRTLLNKSGELQGGPESFLLQIAKGKLQLSAVEREWDSQIQKIRDSGIEPTHLDGHKHIHMLPGLFELAVRLAKKYRIAAIRISLEESKLRAMLSKGNNRKSTVRLKQGLQARVLKLLARDARELADRAGLASTDYFCGIAQTGILRREGMEHFLQNLPDGSTELMCHPGYADDQLRHSPTRLQDSRQSELAILTDAGIRKVVAIGGIRLINFKTLALGS